MPASVNKKCFACAFNTIEFAKEQTCWNCDRCQPKRSYYRKRESINANRRAKYKRALTKDIEIIEVPTPSITAAFLQIYRQGRAKDAPVHALGAYIVVDGINYAKIEPVHTQGWNKRQLDSYVRKCLSSLSSKFGITSFAEKEVMDISIHSCPICADQKQLQRKI
jgi:hypothetical protein